MPTYLIVSGELLFSIIALAWFPLPYLFMAACWLAIFVGFFPEKPDDAGTRLN